MGEKGNILKYLEKIADVIPVAIYWLDMNQKYLGVNKFVIEGTGSQSYEKDFANKTPYDLYPKELADNMAQHHKEAIQTRKTIVAEEVVKTNKISNVKYLNAFISPLYDDEKIIGTIGISIDITAEKEKERLQFENSRRKAELHESQLKEEHLRLEISLQKEEQLQLETELQQPKISEQEGFRKEVGKLIHDVSTPMCCL